MALIQQVKDGKFVDETTGTGSTSTKSSEKDKKTNEYINRPVDSYNHVIDACRYAVEGIRSKVKLKTIKGGL